MGKRAGVVNNNATMILHRIVRIGKIVALYLILGLETLGAGWVTSIASFEALPMEPGSVLLVFRPVLKELGSRAVL